MSVHTKVNIIYSVDFAFFLDEFIKEVILLFITKRFIEKAGGKRSPMVRAAMAQAGKRYAIEGMKLFFLNVGACELTRQDVEANGYKIYSKKYSFMGSPVRLVFIPAGDFDRYPRITNQVFLETAHIQNGFIGIKDVGFQLELKPEANRTTKCVEGDHEL